MQSQPSDLFYHIHYLEAQWERELPVNWKDGLECVQIVRTETSQEVADVLTEEYLRLTNN